MATKSANGDRSLSEDRELFDLQKAYFATDATKSYEWRIDQLDRLVRMLRENDRERSTACSGCCRSVAAR